MSSRSLVPALVWFVTSAALAEEPLPEAPAPEPAPAPETPAPEAPAPETPAPTTGEVVGRLLDPEGLPVPNIEVRIGEQVVMTDENGEFRLELTPGSYTVAVQRPGFYVPGDLIATVAAGQRTSVEIPLQADSSDVYELVVYAPEVVGGVNASIEERKEAASVTEVIGAEQMTKSGDSQATAALSRVTGLTVVDGRYVFVRGLGDRYSSTLLNLSSLPSPEPERRVVPLDLFPTGLLESVSIQKTWSPDLPGEFGGGMVALKTRGIPERPFNQITLTAGYQAMTTLQTAETGYRGPTDWLGLGLGQRALPEPLDAATQDSKLVEADLFSDGFSPEELEKIGESVDSSRWGQEPRQIPPDIGLQIAFGRRIALGGAQLGVFGGLTFNNSWSLDEYTANFYDQGAGDSLELQNSYRFRDLQNQINLGGLGNVGLKLNEQHGIYYTGLLARSSTYMARTYNGFNGDLGSDIRVTRLQWVERQLTFHQMRGEHTIIPLARLRAEWRYALSLAGREEPDQREFRYDLEEATGEYLLSDRPEGNNILYSTLDDRNDDARLDLSLPFGPDREGKVQAGGQIVRRDRGVDTRRFSFFERAALDNDRALPPEQQFNAEQIGPEGYQLKEVTRTTDNYTANQTITAGYLLTDFPFAALAPKARGLKDLSLLAGARLESSAQEVTTFELFNPDQKPIVAKLTATDLLPAATLTQSLLPAPQDPNDDVMQIRAAYARTVSRPDFRELSEAPFTDVTGGREVFGNPELKRALIDHVDLRWEWYPREGELMSVALFYKQFQDPIETVIVPTAQLTVTWENAASAYVRGVEADLRKTLFGLNSALLDRMYVSMNGALIQSRVDLGAASGVQTESERALQGQSPWVLNAQLGYDNTDSKSIATVSFNVAGPRIVEVGAQGAPNTIEQPVPRLDLLLQQGLFRDFYLRLRGRNLLDPNVSLTQGEQVVREGREGWSALLSVEWRP